MPTHYSRTQIALHWAVFILIAFQFLANEPMSEAWEALRKGGDYGFSPLVAGHVVAGGAVAVFALWRLGLRLKRGVPPLPDKEPPMMQLAAHVTHWSLYALMLVVPFSGSMAWFGGVKPAAEAHEVLKTVLLLLVILHVAGALYHQFVLKTNLMQRMKKAG
ncbi:cytochrome b [Thalassovita sp.]|uniref:cytochrome b n=1 Tax=Thalassovita sp. TaxID=1979401 RepID=UPI0029DE78B1|nr:cytochrome b/b6 domain-containing protein [Thalassovita sp.]